MLSVGYFTTLQILFAFFFYSPPLVALLARQLREVGEFFVTARLWEFIIVGFWLYLLALVVPFANLLWVMLIKLFMGGDVCKNNAAPGVYPKWSRMHLRIWCIGRLEITVLLWLRAMYRSAPLMAWVLRQLGATVGKNVQCAHDAFFRAAGPALHRGRCRHPDRSLRPTSRWVGQELHIGPVHLESGCKIGMRAGIANHVTVGRGSWITPLTPILADVGAEEMWEGAPARRRPLHGLKRTANRCRYALPFWLLETSTSSCRSSWISGSASPPLPRSVVTRGLLPAGDAGADVYFQMTPLHEIVWHIGLYAFVTTWVTIVLISVLGCLFIRCTPASPGLYPSRGLRGALLLYRVKMMNRIQRLWTWSITGQYLRALAGVRFPRLGASECDVMLNLVPELARADSQVFWSHGCFTNMLD